MAGTSYRENKSLVLNPTKGLAETSYGAPTQDTWRFGAETSKSRLNATS